MLSELQAVATSLREAGMRPPRVHDWVKPQEKGDFVIACLDEHAHVAQIELRPSSDGARFFKVQKDKHNSFPALKLESPLWDVAADDPARELLKRPDLPNEERAAVVERLCLPGDLTIGVADERRLKARLQVLARELQPMFLSHRDEAPAVCVLIERVLREDLDIRRFLREIRDGIVAAIHGDRDTPRRIGETLLIGTVDAKASKVKTAKVTLVLDIDEHSRWEGDFERVAHTRMEAVYHRALFELPQEGGGEGICALAGTRQPMETGTFAEVKFPVIDNTILFSMNPNTGCHDRYGLIGSAICPVGKQTAEGIYQAAVWITAADRENKTWCKAPEARGDKNDLLIAYVEQSVAADLSLARVFAEGDESDKEAVFETAASTLVDALNTKGAVTRDWTCRVLVLHRISKGQVQVEINRRYSVARIQEALAEWRAGVANTPSISTKLPAKARGAPSESYGPRSLYPGEVLRATKSVWIRGGSERQSIAGCGLGRVFDVFLGEGSVQSEAAEELLRTILERSGPLLVRFGSRADLSPQCRKAAVDACTILAICLYRLNKQKEVFMQEAAFLLGRFLSLADTVHLRYCEIKRDGDVPPQLLGNQHLAMAALNPAGALALLCDRLRIYKGWADTDRSGKAGLAKWAVRQMGEVAAGLTERLPQRALEDNEKAEMLLGYLVRGAKSGDEEGERKEAVQ